MRLSSRRKPGLQTYKGLMGAGGFSSKVVCSCGWQVGPTKGGSSFLPGSQQAAWMTSWHGNCYSAWLIIRDRTRLKQQCFLFLQYLLYRLAMLHCGRRLPKAMSMRSTRRQWLLVQSWKAGYHNITNPIFITVYLYNLCFFKLKSYHFSGSIF